MLISYGKSKKAKDHFRQQKLAEIFWAWRKASHVCRVERQEDFRVSSNYRQSQLTIKAFRRWQDAMTEKQAQNVFVHNFKRTLFATWKHSWERKVFEREVIEKNFWKNKLHKSFLNWRRNVVQQIRRHKAAVNLIESVHLSHTFNLWSCYHLWKNQHRSRMNEHKEKHNKITISASFNLWVAICKKQQNHKAATKMWSDKCTRKFANRWKKKTHTRKLQRIYEDTQILRENRLICKMMLRWRDHLAIRNTENLKAESIMEKFENKCLKKSFNIWKSTSQLYLRIKPLLQRKDNQHTIELFKAWRQFVKHKKHCLQKQKQLEIIYLRRRFTFWKKWYGVRQVEKQVSQVMTKGLQASFFSEWRFLIIRKRQSGLFQEILFLKRCFHYWKSRAELQLSSRLERQNLERDNLNTLEKCFAAWLKNVQDQNARIENTVESFRHRRCHFSQNKTFQMWKDSLHSRLIVRSYIKSKSQTRLKMMLREWKNATNHELKLAVLEFSEKIGITDSGNFQTSTPAEHNIQNDMKIDLDSNPSDLGSLSSSLSMTSGNRRLFGDQDVSLDGEINRLFLLSGGLSDAADSRGIKCLKLKEMAATAIQRLLHWPVCVVFDQWKEFLLYQKLLKDISSNVSDRHNYLQTKFVFNDWKARFFSHSKATSFRNNHLKSHCFGYLLSNAKHKSYTKKLKEKANQHFKSAYVQKYFYPWYQKAQTQKQEKFALKVWTNRTEEEAELYPLESSLSVRLNKRTLTCCFSLWLLKIRHILKLRHVYNSQILIWTFNAWKNWAHQKHAMTLLSKQFLQKRILKLAFTQWEKRRIQSQETKKRFDQSWTNYLTLIFNCWRNWSQNSFRLQRCKTVILRRRSSNAVTSLFKQWRSLTEKYQTVQKKTLTCFQFRVFCEWRILTREKKLKKETILQLRVKSYTFLAQRCFKIWHSNYLCSLSIKEDNKRNVERNALRFAVLWKRRCQKTRAVNYGLVCKHRQLSILFTRWCLALQSVSLKQLPLDDFLNLKRRQQTKEILHHWKLLLLERQVKRQYLVKFMRATLTEWFICSKEMKERQIRGLALTKALQERRLHVYFQYWLNLTKLKYSVQTFTQTNLQIRILRSWHRFTKNMLSLKVIQAKIDQKRCHRISKTYFDVMRWKFEYCQGLNDIANNMNENRQRSTAMYVLNLWRARIDTINAARFYGELLAVRVVRRWRGFVSRKQMKRKKRIENWNKAVACHSIFICKRIILCFKQEVIVSKHIKKRRQRLCHKFAVKWKLLVELRLTSENLDTERVVLKFWKNWRIEFVKETTARKVAQEERRKILVYVFKSWLQLSNKKWRQKNNPEMDACTQNLKNESRRGSTSSLLPIPIKR